jgi:predicted acylesterase/phospholipase RssA
MHPVWKFKAEAQAAEQGSTLQAVVAAAQAGKLGLCFSGAGFGAAYQLGAAQVLEALGILGPHTPVAGVCKLLASPSHAVPL